MEEGSVFYRLKVEENSENYLVSNPIFVHFIEKMPEQVVSVSQSVIDELSIVEPVEPNIQVPKNPIPPSAESPNEPVQDKVANLASKPFESASTTTIGSTPLKVKQPAVPEMKLPSAPTPVLPPMINQKSVVAKINGVSLKNGPGPKFPEVGRLNKGDSLPLIRSTTVRFNGEPWLMVDVDGRKAYVWSQLVATE